MPFALTSTVDPSTDLPRRARLALRHRQPRAPGPRVSHVDTGFPHAATVALPRQGRAGRLRGVTVWACSPGWLGLAQRAPEHGWFYVLSGIRLAVTDLNGAPHRFGPGDVEVLRQRRWPWDITEHIHRFGSRTLHEDKQGHQGDDDGAPSRRLLESLATNLSARGSIENAVAAADGFCGRRPRPLRRRIARTTNAIYSLSNAIDDWELWPVRGGGGAGDDRWKRQRQHRRERGGTARAGSAVSRIPRGGVENGRRRARPRGGPTPSRGAERHHSPPRGHRHQCTPGAHPSLAGDDDDHRLGARFAQRTLDRRARRSAAVRTTRCAPRHLDRFGASAADIQRPRRARLRGHGDKVFATRGLRVPVQDAPPHTVAPVMFDARTSRFAKRPTA